MSAKETFKKNNGSCEITLETNDGLQHDTYTEDGLGDPGEQFYVLLLIDIYIYTTQLLVSISIIDNWVHHWQHRHVDILVLYWGLHNQIRN